MQESLFRIFKMKSYSLVVYKFTCYNIFVLIYLFRIHTKYDDNKLKYLQTKDWSQSHSLQQYHITEMACFNY